MMSEHLISARLKCTCIQYFIREVAIQHNFRFAHGRFIEATVPLSTLPGSIFGCVCLLNRGKAPIFVNR